MTNSHYQTIISTYEDESTVTVHEAFTDENGNIQAITDYPVTIDGESLGDVKRKLNSILWDINKHPPILDKDIDKVLSITDPEPYCIPLDEMEEEDYSYEIDTDEDLVDIFNKRGR